MACLVLGTESSSGKINVLNENNLFPVRSYTVQHTVHQINFFLNYSTLYKTNVYNIKCIAYKIKFYRLKGQ